MPKLWSEPGRWSHWAFDLLYSKKGAKILAIAYSYGECIVKSGRHIF